MERTVSIFSQEAKERLDGVAIEDARGDEHETSALASLEEQMLLIQRQVARLGSQASQRGQASAAQGSEEDAESSTGSEESEDEDQEESQSKVIRTGARVAFQDSQGAWVALYRDIFSDKTAEALQQQVEQLSSSKQPWAFFMLAGGHFAAAVVRKGKVELHKTIHRYVVRAKRGTVQSVRDAKSGTSAPKSAGANLRRYNEAELRREIAELLLSWSASIAECSLVFHRTSTHNRSFLFGTKNDDKKTPGTYLSSKDERVRAIPFPTRRPTLKEISRVYAQLSSLYILPFAPAAPKTAEVEEDEQTSSHTLTTSIVDVTQEPVEPAKPKSAKTRSKPESTSEQAIAMCNKGDLNGIRRLLGLESYQKEDIDDLRQHHDFIRGEAVWIQACRDADGNTILHLAAKKGHPEIVKVLLEHGADPRELNEKRQTPYEVASSKETRSVFRRFVAAFPDEVDLAQAKIPSALSYEAELKQSESKASKAKADKAKRRARQKQKQEEQEKVAVKSALSMASSTASAREKRAAAALARQTKQVPENFQGPYCGWCGGPCGLEQHIFRRLEFEYCSMDCLKRHRTSLEK